MGLLCLIVHTCVHAHMHALFCLVTCPLCELKLTVAATPYWALFYGSSPGLCYQTLSPILFHFSLVLLIYLSQNRNAHSRTPNNNHKDLRRKVNISPFSLLWSSGLFSKYYHCEISSVIFHKDKLYRCWLWIKTTHTEPLKHYWGGMILYPFFTPCSLTSYYTLKSSSTLPFSVAIPIVLYWWARISY